MLQHFQQCIFFDDFLINLKHLSIYNHNFYLNNKHQVHLQYLQQYDQLLIYLKYKYFENAFILHLLYTQDNYYDYLTIKKYIFYKMYGFIKINQYPHFNLVGSSNTAAQIIHFRYLEIECSLTKFRSYFVFYII